MSRDPEQEYLADGICEDIITALSKIRVFTVIARNSTFSYKGRSVDIKQVAKDLKVNYVLEGSLRRSGDRVRITAQLIDHEGLHVWAEKYDRVIEDIFELQDEMTQTIAAALEPELHAVERERAVRNPQKASTPGNVINAAFGICGNMKKKKRLPHGIYFRRPLTWTLVLQPHMPARVTAITIR